MSGRRAAAAALAVAGTLPLLLIGGCQDFGAELQAPRLEPDPPPAATVSFADDIQPLFDQHCVGCHGLGGLAALDLRADASFASLVDVIATEIDGPRVDPGRPENSWLITKLTEDPPPVGDRMPQGGLPLAPGEIDQIALWISEGALDN